MTTLKYTTADLLNDPFLIGFDTMFDRLGSTTRGHTNYPPYNVVKTDEDHYVVEIAVAGFHENDIEITLEDRTLTIKGDKEENTGQRNYIHRGISARSFTRAFTLADSIVVKGAEILNGVLQIQLENVIPEEKRPQKIAITGSKTLLTE